MCVWGGGGGGGGGRAKFVTIYLGWLVMCDKLLFCYLKKGLTPKNRMLCFVITNSVFRLFCFLTLCAFGTLVVILVSDYYYYFLRWVFRRKEKSLKQNWWLAFWNKLQKVKKNAGFKILIEHHKTCAYFRGKPFFQSNGLTGKRWWTIYFNI